MLAAYPNLVVSVDALVEELWGDRAPRSARTTLQGYVVHLRKLIGSIWSSAGQRGDAKHVIVTTPTGYRLDNGGGDVDATRFIDLTEAGHLARQHGDDAGAALQFAGALECWRGPALMDVQRGTHLERLATRLEEDRLNVLDCRIEADLRLGRHHELLGELAGLVSRHTTHEGLHAHYMLALYRCGRRCEAVSAYRRLHDALHSEHGLQPAPALRRLHRSMLSPDQGPALTPAGPAAGHRTAAQGRGPGRGVPVREPARRSGVLTELAAIPWDAADGSTDSWRPHPDTNDTSA